MANNNRHYVFLIPGFFGFDQVGGISYFHHVKQYLSNELKERGYDPEITAVRTLPTASIRRRSIRVLETMDEVVEEEAPIHLIGHSTGGLDARMLTSPGVKLPTKIDPEKYRDKIESVISIASPHRGTPLANYFNSLSGKNLLYVLSLITIYSLRFGNLPLSVLLYLSGYLMKFDRYIGIFRNTMVDQVHDRLLSDFDLERKKEIDELLKCIKEDRAAIVQLTPSGNDIFDALVQDSEEIRYGCVPVKAPRQGLKSFGSVSWHPYQKGMNVLFQLLYRLVKEESSDPTIDETLKQKCEEIPDMEINKTDNDGIVPVYSQFHGSVIHVAVADHLDVCGHFHGPDHEPPHINWLASGAGFNRADYERLWSEVSDFMCEDE